MQPGITATQSAATVASESKLKAADTIQPAIRYWQPPLSTLAVGLLAGCRYSLVRVRVRVGVGVRVRVRVRSGWG